jgi:hypothetical protein
VRIALKKPFRDGTVVVDLDPLSLLCRLVALVPAPTRSSSAPRAAQLQDPRRPTPTTHRLLPAARAVRGALNTESPPPAPPCAASQAISGPRRSNYLSAGRPRKALLLPARFEMSKKRRQPEHGRGQARELADGRGQAEALNALVDACSSELGGAARPVRARLRLRARGGPLTPGLRPDVRVPQGALRRWAVGLSRL